jgi:hypothetical protein
LAVHGHSSIVFAAELSYQSFHPPFEHIPKRLLAQAAMQNVQPTTGIEVEAEKENSVALWVI